MLGGKVGFGVGVGGIGVGVGVGGEVGGAVGSGVGEDVGGEPVVGVPGMVGIPGMVGVPGMPGMSGILVGVQVGVGVDMPPPSAQPARVNRMRMNRKKQEFSAMAFAFALILPPTTGMPFLPDHQSAECNPDAGVGVEIVAVFKDQPRTPIIHRVILAAQVGDGAFFAQNHAPFGGECPGQGDGRGLVGGLADETVAVALVVAPFGVAGGVVTDVFAQAGHAVEIMFCFLCPLFPEDAVAAACITGASS